MPRSRLMNIQANVAPIVALACLVGVQMAAPQSLSSQGNIRTGRLVEEVRILSNDSSTATSLTGVTALLALRDGTILSAHSREGVVRVFDSTGKFLRVLGRFGDGPGEFRSPNGVGLLGDTIWIRDIGNSRYHLYSAQLSPVGALRVVTVSGYYLGPISSKETVFRALGDSTKVGVYDAKGALVRVVPIHVGALGHRFQVRDGAAPGGVRMLTSPLPTVTDVVFSSEGKEVILLEPSALWGGAPGQLGVRRVSLTTGAMSPRVVASFEPKRITQRQTDSIMDAQAYRFTADVARQHEQLARLPEYFPSHRLARMMGDGLIWLSHYDSPQVWTVMNVDGKIVMRLELPPGLNPYFANNRHVWGTILDADDVPSIVRYRIQ